MKKRIGSDHRRGLKDGEFRPYPVRSGAGGGLLQLERRPCVALKLSRGAHDQLRFEPAAVVDVGASGDPLHQTFEAHCRQPLHVLRHSRQGRTRILAQRVIVVSRDTQARQSADGQARLARRSHDAEGNSIVGAQNCAVESCAVFEQSARLFEGYPLKVPVAGLDGEYSRFGAVLLHRGFIGQAALPRVLVDVGHIEIASRRA